MSANISVHNVVRISRKVDEYHGTEAYANRPYSATTLKFECKSPHEEHVEVVEFTFYGLIGLEIEKGTTKVHGEPLGGVWASILTKQDLETGK